MKFSIITPTYKRPEMLQRAIASVQAQTHPNWELIIVNDNPGDETREIVNTFTDSRIRYFEQPVNAGVNATRNLALTEVSKDSDFIVLLDDDDYLTSDSLATMESLVRETQSLWLVTSLAFSNGEQITKSKTAPKRYHYFRDYLVCRRLKGDATHCIATTLVHGPMAHLRFPAIRQGEEWLFFASVGRYTPIQFVDVVTKLTDGYEATGLNYRRRRIGEQLRLIPVFIREGYTRGLWRQPLFWLYIGLRILRAFLK
jgi:glycosyltransferase involved in cell wall biosynthesis